MEIGRPDGAMLPVGLGRIGNLAVCWRPTGLDIECIPREQKASILGISEALT
jgi:hypothetical protein